LRFGHVRESRWRRPDLHGDQTDVIRERLRFDEAMQLGHDGLSYFSWRPTEAVLEGDPQSVESKFLARRTVQFG